MKIYNFCLIFLLFVGVVVASQPPVTDPLRFTGEPSMTTIPPPPATDSGSYSCQAWIVRNEKCEGNLRIYEQCIQMVNTNVWNFRSENCAELGATCENGVCVGYGSNLPNPVIPLCGNNKCDGSETSVTCPSDCQTPAANLPMPKWIIGGIILFAIIALLRRRGK